MAGLGKDGSTPPIGAGIISVSYTEECEVIDVSNRSNVGGSQGNPGYRANKAGLKSTMWEIECHDASGLIAALESGSGVKVMGVTENISIDGAVTFTVTARG